MIKHQNLTELFNNSEPLCEELEQYRTEDNGMVMIRHPLLYSIPHFENLNALSNQQLKYMKQLVAKARRMKDWEQFVGWHEKPHRFTALATVAKKMSDVQFWRCFRETWMASENIWQNKEIILKFLRSKRPHRHMMMDKKEQKELHGLAEVVVVYRGHQIVNDEGLSWTLDQEQAEWFANRFGLQGYVTEGTILRSKIIALLLGRDEREVICFSQDVKERDTWLVKKK